MSYRIRPFAGITLSLILTGSLLTAEGFAAEGMKSDDSSASASATGGSTSDELMGAKETVREAAKVVQKIKSDPQASDLLEQAKAIFVVPDYARAALVVGGAGGQGVLVAKHDGEWSAPAFYNIGTVQIGAAAGAEAGEVAFVILSGDLLESFGQMHNFALNSDTGYTVVEDSERNQTSIGKGTDVAVWSATEGLYGDFAASVSDIFWDEGANNAYYGQEVTATEIINGEVEDPMSPSPLLSAETP
ncbi:MAG: YSC84-related protein [Halochromatium sp.]